MAVTDEQLTDKLEEALATADNSFPVEITDKYTFEDPKGLEYDTRYVLYGGEDSGAVSAAGQWSGAQVNGVYEIYYSKDGEIVAGYRCFDAASAADAEQLKASMAIKPQWAMMGTKSRLDGRSRSGRQSNSLTMGSRYAEDDAYQLILTMVTPEGYMQALIKNEGYQYFRNPNPAEEPEEPSGGLTGTTPDEAFSVKVSDSYTYDEAQVLPGPEYDRRYVLYGDETNGFAAQQGANAFYEVIYEQDSRALYEIKIYVMPSARRKPGALAGQLVDAGLYAVAMPGTDAVLVIGTDLQDTIDMYAQYGQIAEATPRAYIEGFLMKLGMTEVTADGNSAFLHLLAPGSSEPPALRGGGTAGYEEPRSGRRRSPRR